MSLIAKKARNSEVNPIPEGAHLAVCYGVIDLGTHVHPTYKKAKRKVLVQWELPECRGQFEKDGEMKDLPRAISRRYTLSLHEKADLRRDLECWRGQRFTDEELGGFDMTKLLGCGCRIQVVHATGDEKRVYANVQAIMSMPKGQPKKIMTENPQVSFSFEEWDGNDDSLPNVPEWVLTIMRDSQEYQKVLAGADEPQGTPTPEKDDDLPF